jgi:glutaredoxin
MLFTVYTQPSCTFCEQAKSLIKSKGHTYQEVTLNVGQKQEEGKTYIPLTQFKTKFPKVKSVPLIVEGNTIIGGFDQLKTFLRYD